jgi:hypothetical protein
MLVLLVGGIYKLAIEMGSGTLIYIPSFIKIVTHADSKVITKAYFYFPK